MYHYYILNTFVIVVRSQLRKQQIMEDQFTHSKVALVGDRFVHPQIIPDNTHVRTYQLPWTRAQADHRSMRERFERVQLTLQISGQNRAF